MQTASWAIALLGAPILPAALGFANQLAGVSTLLAREWWLVPLSTSAASTLTLAVAAATGRTGESQISAALLTGIYLMSGPSAALLNLSSLLSVGVSPPEWVRCATPILLLSAAWIYYHATGDSKDESRARQESLGWAFIPQ